MTPLEIILLIFVIVETVQVFFLLRNTRQLRKMVDDIIHNPDYASAVAVNTVFGLINALDDTQCTKKELPTVRQRQQSLIAFTRFILHNALAEGKDMINNPNFKPSKKVRDVMGYAQVLAQVADFLGLAGGSTVSKAAGLARTAQNQSEDW